MPHEPAALHVPTRVAWTVTLFLAAWTLGGLYYAGRVVAQLERAVDELAAVKVEQVEHDHRITRNREDIIRLRSGDAERQPWPGDRP